MTTGPIPPQRDEEAVRAMLRRRAGDVHPSPDAWDAIAARLDEPGGATVVALHGPGRRRPGGHGGSRRRVVAGAAAAAVAAATVGGAALLSTGPTSLVADAPPATAPADMELREPSGEPIPAVWPQPTAAALREMAELDQVLLDPRETAVTYLSDRLAPDGGDIGLEVSELQAGDAQSGEVTYRTDDGPSGQVLLRRLGGDGTPWYVVAAATELLTYDQVVEDGAAVLRVTSEVAGTMAYDVRTTDGEVVLSGEEPVPPRGTVVLGELDREGAVTVRATTSGPDGRTTAFLEVRAEPNPAGPGDLLDDDFPGVHPVTRRADLDALQARVDAGEVDAEAPEAVARDLLAALGLDGATPGPFAAGDALSGEVPFRTADGATGTVALRRLSEGGVWFATGVTSDDVRIVAVRPEPGTLVVDVETARPGTVTGTAAAPGAPRAVEAVAQHLDRAMTTSLGFAGVDGPAVVVVRFSAAGGPTSVAVTRP